MENEKVEVFEIDDDFDPLEDTGIEDDEEFEGKDADTDYQVPVIPDADKSVVPDPVVLPPEERIANLIKGLPGQKFRILEGIRVCDGEPKTLEEASEALEAAFPQGASVYPAARIIELLADAGALDRIEPEAPESTEDETGGAVAAEGESQGRAGSESPQNAEVLASERPADTVADAERVESITWDDVDENVTYEEVEQAAPALYVATDAGRQAVEQRWSAHVAAKVVTDEPNYLPIWKKVLELCSVEGGATKPSIASQIDDDPLLKEPRRWCQYFLGKYKDVNALTWDKTWQITDIGRELLDSDLFADVADAAGVGEAGNEGQAEKIPA